MWRWTRSIGFSLVAAPTVAIVLGFLTLEPTGV